MTPPPAPYGQSLALLTDLYELTMAYGFWKSGMAEREAVFHLYFRRAPFGGAFAIACGIGPVAEFLRGFRFAPDDLDYLRTLRASDGQALFEPGFLEYLQAFEFHCDIDAVPEGTAVFAQEPLVRVRGPLLQAQILETALLNIVNFQTLIATKAARLAHAAQGEPILEFGLRRAQGIDGGLAASRAAYAGGCAATSNVLAGKLYGIPVRGTHAHSWVMSFDSEQLAAFRAWAKAMPANCIFLVDTYDSIEGVRNAIEAGKELRRQGHEMLGIRLDSGDLAALSREARRMLDDAGFATARIVASGDLDERRIPELHAEGARIAVWGVGTRLVTAYDEPALGGVYKLGAIRENGDWSDRLKLSDDVDKISNPGVQQVRRYSVDGRPALDVLYDESRPPSGEMSAVALIEPFENIPIPERAVGTDLLEPLFRDGVCLHEPPSLESVRSYAEKQRQALAPALLADRPTAEYPVGLERSLHRHKQELIARHGLSASRTG